MDPGSIFYMFTVTCNFYCFPHCAFNSLFCKTGGIDNLSVSSWAKFWFVVVQIPSCWGLHHRTLSRQLGTSSFLAPLPGIWKHFYSANLHLPATALFLAPLPGILEATGKGSLSVPFSLLCFCSCFSFVLLAVKNQKSKKISFLHLVVIFELPCCLF